MLQKSICPLTDFFVLIRPGFCHTQMLQIDKQILITNITGLITVFKL